MTQVSAQRPATLTLDLDTIANIASSRWFQTPEIMMILTRFHDIGLTVSECLPQRPQSGSLYFVMKKENRYWRSDGWRWRTRRDSKALLEHHDKLRVDGAEKIACVYSQCDEWPALFRRAYCLLPNVSEMDGILMVHYLVVEDSQRLKRQRSLETPAAEPSRQEATDSESLLEQQRKSMIEHQARMHEWFVRQQQQPGLAPLHSPLPVPSISESTWSPSLPGLLPTDPVYLPSISLPASSDMSEIFADQPPIESHPSITYRHSRLDPHDLRVCLIDSMLQLGQLLQKPQLTAFSFADLSQLARNGPEDDWLEVLVARVLARVAPPQTLPSVWVCQPRSIRCSAPSTNQNASSSTSAASACSVHGLSLLHVVAAHDCAHLIAPLVNSYPSVINAHCASVGRTPLHYAAANGCEAAVSALLLFGADVDAKDSNGDLPVDLAKLNNGNSTSDVYARIVSVLQSLDTSMHHDEYEEEPSLWEEPLSDEEPKVAAEMSAASPPSNVAELNRDFSTMTLQDMGISSAEVDHHTTEEAFESAVTSIQRKIRTWLYRRHEAAKKLQAATRAWLARKNLKRKMNESATLIQSLVRSRATQRRFQQLKSAAQLVQKRFRERHAMPPIQLTMSPQVQPLPELASSQVSLMQLPPPHSNDMLFGANSSPARLDPFGTFDSF